MSAREPSDRHSDLGPSSKDWQTGSPGRDEDFTPEKDLWTQARKGDLGAGRPGEDVHSESAGSARRDNANDDVQPGTHHEGKSWQSRRPQPGDEDDKLDQALKDTFPTSDPPQPAQPGVTGWDLEDRDRGFDGRPGRSAMRAPAWRRQVRTRSPGLPLLAVGLALLPVLVLGALTLSRPRRSRPRRS